MKTNSTGHQPGQVKNSHLTNNAHTAEVVEALSTVSLRCVECAALYPGIEVGASPRYRCDCGGVLDVWTKFSPPRSHTTPSINAHSNFVTDLDLCSPPGAQLRQ